MNISVYQILFFQMIKLRYQMLWLEHYGQC